MGYYINEQTKMWEAHPSGVRGVALKKLRSSKAGIFQESIALVRIEAGAAVPEHVHKKEDDNLYILQGKGMMRIGDETFGLEKGVQITVPAGEKHEIFDVTEELLMYDVFVPGIF